MYMNYLCIKETKNIIFNKATFALESENNKKVSKFLD